MDTGSDAAQFQATLVTTPWFYKQWLLAGNRAQFFDTISRDFGDFVHYRGLFQFYWVNHPQLVKSVLQQTHTEFDKQSIIYQRFQRIFGTGLVVAEGEAWRRRRRILQPMFGPSAIRQYLDGMLQSVDRLHRRWDEHREHQTATDIMDDMNQLALEIAGRALFHDTFNANSDDIQRWTHDINYYCGKPPLPVIRSYWFPSRLNRRIKKTLSEFHAWIQTQIEVRRTQTESRDLLCLLLQSKNEDTGIGMKDAEIRDEVLGMIIGGHETTSAALTWIWCELTQHPEVESKLHRELAEVIGDESLRLEHLPKLVYTKMVIDETLRLHPPFWFENRNAQCDLELGGVTIPKGSLVVFSRYSLHRHPLFWKNANEFDPERFRPRSEENVRSVYASIPFGGGPRICIGIHFAMMELIVALAALAKDFRVRCIDPEKLGMSANLTMLPRSRVKARIDQSARTVAKSL